MPKGKDAVASQLARLEHATDVGSALYLVLLDADLWSELIARYAVRMRALLAAAMGVDPASLGPE